MEDTLSITLPASLLALEKACDDLAVAALMKVSCSTISHAQSAIGVRGGSFDHIPVQQQLRGPPWYGCPNLAFENRQCFCAVLARGKLQG